MISLSAFGKCHKMIKIFLGDFAVIIPRRHSDHHIKFILIDP